MTSRSAEDESHSGEQRLPRRDWIVLPLTGLLTVGLLAGSAEWTARRMFWMSQTSVYNCIAMDDPSTGFRGIPNCVCGGKDAETQWTDYRFNDCGLRADRPCGPKPEGSYRVVLLGSSFTLGEFVQREKTFAALLPAELEQRTGRRIDVYNEAIMQQSPASVALRFPEFVAAKPDMILWMLTPWDIQQAAVTLPHFGQPVKRTFMGTTRQRVLGALKKKPLDAAAELQKIVHDLLMTSHTRLMAQHFFYESQSEYVKAYLAGDEEQTGFLRSEPGAAWQDYLRQFESYDLEIERRARAAGVPLVAVLLPYRSQAAMVAMGTWPNGSDPYKLDNELRSIVTGHGGIYLDILPDYRGVPNPERGYFPVDSHPNEAGHAVIARLLARELTGGQVLALKTGAPPQ